MYYIKQDDRFIPTSDKLTVAKIKATKSGNGVVYSQSKKGIYTRVSIKINGKWS